MQSYEPGDKPGKPEATAITHNSINLEWSKPQCGSKNVRSYTLHTAGN